VCSEIISCDDFIRTVCSKCRKTLEEICWKKSYSNWKKKNKIGEKFRDKRKQTLDLLRLGSKFEEFKCNPSAFRHRIRLLKRQGYKIEKQVIYRIISEPKK
jgi:hypothetical protein